MAQSVPASALFKLVEGCVKFPFPQVCRHLVALDLLSVMMEAGVEVPDELVKAISQSSGGDEKAMEILLEMKKSVPNELV